MRPRKKEGGDAKWQSLALHTMAACMVGYPLETAASASLSLPSC